MSNRERPGKPGAGPEASKTRRRGTLNAVAFGGAIIVLILLAAVVLWPRPTRELPVYWNAPEFTLVNQQGDTVRIADLRGTPWVASFVFTHCTSVCPVITHKMAALGDSLEAEGLLGTGARLVSFTVDPARDTPAVLREYAAGFGSRRPEQWMFLTGTPPEAVREMIQTGFKLTASAPPGHDHGGGEYQVMHSPRVVLVDALGQVRGLYDTTEPDAMRQVRDDLQALISGASVRTSGTRL